MKELLAQQKSAQRDFELARANAEAVANQESAALDSDDSYASWMRRKKLADVEAARLEHEIASIADEIEAERGRQERDAFRRRYEAVKATNRELRARLISFREKVLPEILTLLRDLAQDDIDVETINKLVPWGEGLNKADSAIRSRPSQAETVISDEVVELWCDRTGRELPNQEVVAVDASGAGSIAADFGRRRIEVFKRKFRQIEKLAWRPASDAIPLWREFVIPRFDQIDVPTYDGNQTYSAQQALQLLALPRRGHPRDRIVEIVPIDRGNQLSDKIDTGPAIPT